MARRGIASVACVAALWLGCASGFAAQGPDGVPNPDSPAANAPATRASDLPKAVPIERPADPKAAAGAPAAVGKQSVLKLVTNANPMLWPLAVCSVVAVGYALERLVALRRSRVAPREFTTRFIERLASGKLDKDRAAELCRANDSPAARVFGIVVSNWGQPAATIRQAVGYDAAGEVTDLKRNVRVLNATATLAPLLGLLGTVVGMIQSFDAIGGRVGSSRSEALAHGISLALVTTAAGLAIAVVSVAAYYYLLNRVDVLVRELDAKAREAIDLVAAEALRPATVERRPNFAAGYEHGRAEPRAHRGDLA
jgi:biopolymer transport protein ExbB